MRRLLLVAVLAGFCLTLTAGCGAFMTMGGAGMFYADTKAPSNALAYYGPTTSANSKMGKAQFSAILGILATGDASLDAAMRAGGITKIHHVDTQYTNILGIIQTYTLIVYGE
jgi:hypothetical protein